MDEQTFLEEYQIADYERPSVACDMVIFTIDQEAEENFRKLKKMKPQVLLIQRGQHPFMGAWALPGGFVRPNETCEQTASRELREETGISKAYLEQLYTFSNPGRDPRGWIMSCAYMALLPREKVTLKAGDDAINALWFTLDVSVRKEVVEQKIDGILRTQTIQLSLIHENIVLKSQVVKETFVDEEHEESTIHIQTSDIAFDHAQIIVYALQRLRGKLEYSDIIFHLMPKTFTLTQLQQAYECILDKELLKANFRRKMRDMVLETKEYQEHGGHRPSRLYKQNKEKLL